MFIFLNIIIGLVVLGTAFLLLLVGFFLGMAINISMDKHEEDDWNDEQE